jgi:hypothetical protein
VQVQLLVSVWASLSFVTPVWASGPSYDFKDGHLILRASSRDQISGEVRALSAWKARVEGTSCNATIEEGADGVFTSDVTECAPKVALQVYGQRPNSDGPNCYNLALLTAGLTPYVNHASDDEIEFLLGPPFCERVRGGNPSPGDIVFIRHQGRPDHAYIHISGETAWAKDSFSRMDPAFLVPQSYTRRGRMDLPTEYFSCRPLEAVLDGKDLETGLREALSSANQVDARFSEYAVRGRPLDQAALGSLSSTLIVLGKYYSKEVASQAVQKPPVSHRDLALGLLAVKLLRLGMLVGHLEGSSLEEDLGKLLRQEQSGNLPRVEELEPTHPSSGSQAN